MERKKLNFRKLRKFAKNAKALSPVIATIILIAVTVAVSVVVAAWMGGLTLGFMGSAEQASVTNVVLTNITAQAPSPILAAASCRHCSKHRFRYSVNIFSNYRWKHRDCSHICSKPVLAIAANGQVTLLKAPQ